MAHFLRGQIIKILDSQRIIINLGADHGIQNGDRFCAYDYGEEVTDLESGEVLGKLELIKTELEAVHVQEKITLLMPIPKPSYTSTPQVLSATLSLTTPYGRGASERDMLNVRSDQITGSTHVSPISVGDWIRSVKQYGN